MYVWIGIISIGLSALLFTGTRKGWIPKGLLSGLAVLLALFSAVVALGAFLTPWMK